MSNEIQEYKPNEIFFDDHKMKSMCKMAELMAQAGDMIPEHFRGDSKVGACFAVVMQSVSWGLNPFVVAQKTFLVKGVLGYEAQLVNAVITGSGIIKGAFKYHYEGENNLMKCRVSAIIKESGEEIFGEWLAISSVKIKNSPLWATNPKQQIAYLQVKNWSRLYYPSIIMGVYTKDEVDEIVKEKDITPVVHQEEKKHVELPALDDEKFTNTYSAFLKAVESGKKTTQDIINSVSSTWKLRQEQIEAIEDIDNIIAEKKKEKESKEVEDTKKFDPNAPEDNEIPFSDD